MVWKISISVTIGKHCLYIFVLLTWNLVSSIPFSWIDLYYLWMIQGTDSVHLLFLCTTCSALYSTKWFVNVTFLCIINFNKPYNFKCMFHETRKMILLIKVFEKIWLVSDIMCESFCSHEQQFPSFKIFKLQMYFKIIHF